MNFCVSESACFLTSSQCLVSLYTIRINSLQHCTCVSIPWGYPQAWGEGYSSRTYVSLQAIWNWASYPPALDHCMFRNSKGGYLAPFYKQKFSTWPLLKNCLLKLPTSLKFTFQFVSGIWGFITFFFSAEWWLKKIIMHCFDFPW